MRQWLRVLCGVLLAYAAPVSINPASAQFAVPDAAPLDGAALFGRQCGTCHSLKEGETRQGPSLAGVYGRAAGKQAGFGYSAGLVAADWAWDDAHLDPYLTNPQAMVVGGVMAYRQGNPEIRAKVIAYLKEGG